MSDVRVPMDRIRSLSKEELESIQSDEGAFLEFFTKIKPDLVDVRAMSGICCMRVHGGTVASCGPPCICMRVEHSLVCQPLPMEGSGELVLSPVKSLMWPI